MTSADIKKLRLSGRLDEALIMAQQEYAAQSNGLWQRSALAWVYDAICKRAAEAGDLEAFRTAFVPLAELGLFGQDNILTDAMSWRLRALLQTGCDRLKDSVPELVSWGNEVLPLFQLFRPMPRSLATSVLCKTLLKVHPQWYGFVSILDCWGWNLFREEDYVPEVLPDGKRMPLSLVESCYLRYAKLLLGAGESTQISAFLPQLESLAEAHPEMMYLGYYAGKLMMALGMDTDSVLRNVLPFARKKKSEFWVWQMLAEAQKEDNAMYLACLLRAAHCKTQDAFLIKVFYMLTAHYVSVGDFDHAKYYLARYVKAKNQFNGNLPSDVWCWVHESWYESSAIAVAAAPKKEVFMIPTNALLYQDMQEVPAVVTFVNKEKKMVTVVCGEHKQGFFSYQSLQLTPESGNCLMLRMETSADSERLSVHTARVVQPAELPTCTFIRSVIGAITCNRAKTAHFVNFGSDYAFLPPALLSANPNYSCGDVCQAWVVCSYDKSKQRWSWMCLKIQ